MRNATFILLLVFLTAAVAVKAQHLTYHLFEPVNFSQVTIKDAFWKPKVDKVATTTLQACIYQTEVATPRIENFKIDAGQKQGKFKGIFYDDSDVFKALEAIAYSLKNKPDAALEKRPMSGST